MEKSLERPGYTFAGWYIDKECTKRINPGGKLPHAITLYDKWTPVLFPIHYDLHGGQNDKRNPRFVTIESGLVKLYPADKENMQFAGWMMDGKVIQLLPEGINRPVTLHAIYKKPFKATLQTNGGSGLAPRSANSHGKLDPFEPPQKLGSVFAGWYTDPSLTDPFDFDTELEHNILLYAKWEPESWPIRYHLDGGIASRQNPRRYQYSEDIIHLLPAKKKGHRFLGWFDPAGREVSHIPPRSVGPRELYAKYRPVKSHAKKD